MKVIGLVGHIESGKNHIASLLEKQFGYKCLMMAGLAKSVVSQTEGVSLEQLEDRKYKEEYRPKVKATAEAFKKALGETVHCKYIDNLIHQLCFTERRYSKIVISDVRYPYEYLFFRERFRLIKTPIDFKILKVESDLIDKTKASKEDSESYIDTYFSQYNDGVIFNGEEQRYDRDNLDLIGQLVKFVN
jgi:dephospho-CoA kinase